MHATPKTETHQPPSHMGGSQISAWRGYADRRGCPEVGPSKDHGKHPAKDAKAHCKTTGDGLSEHGWGIHAVRFVITWEHHAVTPKDQRIATIPLRQRNAGL